MRSSDFPLCLCLPLSLNSETFFFPYPATVALMQPLEAEDKTVEAYQSTNLSVFHVFKIVAQMSSTQFNVSTFRLPPTAVSIGNIWKQHKYTYKLQLEAVRVPD